jgi:P-type Ca2+ transporter type 2C
MDDPIKATPEIPEQHLSEPPKTQQDHAAEKPLQGLSLDEAAQRLKRDGPNQLPKLHQRNFLRILIDTFKEPMFALLMAGGATYWLLGDHTEAFLLLLFATFSISITLVQESRSERVTYQRPACVTWPKAIV